MLRGGRSCILTDLFIFCLPVRSLPSSNNTVADVVRSSNSSNSSNSNKRWCKLPFRQCRLLCPGNIIPGCQLKRRRSQADKFLVLCFLTSKQVKCLDLWACRNQATLT